MGLKPLNLLIEQSTPVSDSHLADPAVPWRQSSLVRQNKYECVWKVPRKVSDTCSTPHKWQPLSGILLLSCLCSLFGLDCTEQWNRDSTRSEAELDCVMWDTFQSCTTWETRLLCFFGNLIFSVYIFSICYCCNGHLEIIQPHMGYKHSLR